MRLTLISRPAPTTIAPDAIGDGLSMVVTSPPTENRTIGGEEVGVGLCDWYGELEFWRRVDICSGEAGRLRLLNRLISSADRLWCRWINISDAFSGTARKAGNREIN